MRQNIQQFSSIGDFIDYLEVTPSNNWEEKARSSRKTGIYEFYHSRSFGECTDYAVKGWPEGLDKVSSQMGLCRSTGRSKINIYDVCGETPHIGRFLSGAPDSMTRRVIREGHKRPIIDIVINACYSYGIDAEYIMNYGAAIAVVIDELENKGYSVGLYVGAANSADNAGETYGALIEVKKAGEIMDMDRLIFFTAHPSFLRRLMFGYWETKYVESGFAWGYGEIGEIENSNMPEGSIYFGMQDLNLTKNCATIDKGRQFIWDRIKSQRPDMVEHDLAA